MNIAGMTSCELVSAVKERYGKGPYHALKLYKAIFKKGINNPESMAEAFQSPASASQLARDIRFPSCKIIKKQKDTVTKFASKLGDGNIIESVIIPAKNRNTLCVSSQVGCTWGCTFCATGDSGLKRNLTAEEIVWQVFAARFIIKNKIDNIVFMGMGEPLDNFDNMVQAIKVFSDQHGFDISQSHITVSTAGQCAGLRKLAQSGLRKINLAVSINAADDDLRTRLMPINHTYPLSRLKKELADYPFGKKGTVLIEYVLLKGINDSKEQAEKLVSFCDGLPVRINIIPYNQGSAASYQSPSREDINTFKGWLTEKNHFVRIRQSYGSTISAACGQLGSSLS